MLLYKALLSILLLCPLFAFANDEDCSDSALDITVSPPPYTYYLNDTETFITHELDNSTGALCLDGSNYKFFFRAGTGEGLGKFMIFFPGGGYCGYENANILESCKYRSKGKGGSSMYYEAAGEPYVVDYSLGYFSSDPITNPLFWSWNKVFMTYCDGTIFQGYRSSPVEFDGTQLYFRGYNNTVSLFEYLRSSMGLFSASEVMLVGVSSGGHGMMLWLNWIREFLPESVKLRGLSDAGLFLDDINQRSHCHLFRKHMKTIANFTNSADLELFRACKDRNNSEKFYKCLIPEYFLEKVKPDVDLFFANSLNDFETLRSAGGLHCLDHGLESCPEDINAKIPKFTQKFLKFALKLKKSRPNWGFWLRRCIEHYFMNSIAWMENLTVYSAESFVEKNLRGALYEWYLEGSSASSYIDLRTYEDDCPIKAPN